MAKTLGVARSTVWYNECTATATPKGLKEHRRQLKQMTAENRVCSAVKKNNFTASN